MAGFHYISPHNGPACIHCVEIIKPGSSPRPQTLRHYIHLHVHTSNGQRLLGERLQLTTTAAVTARAWFTPPEMNVKNLLIAFLASFSTHCFCCHLRPGINTCPTGSGHRWAVLSTAVHTWHSDVSVTTYIVSTLHDACAIITNLTFRFQQWEIIL